MEIGERERQLQQLAGFDPAAADLDELRQALRVINTTSGWLHTLKVGAKRRLEQLEAANQPSPTNPAPGSGGGVDGLGGSVGEEMINCGGKSNADANATYEHDRVFSDFNGLEQLVADGKVSIDHVNALARLTKKLTDAERSELQLHRDDILAAAVREYLGAFARYIKRLLAQIREANEEADAVARLERQVAATNIRQWTDDSSGMYHAHLEMDPIRGAQFRTAVDREYRRLRQLPENKDRDHDQVMADAIIAATTNPNSDSPGLPEINIIITADHLTKHTTSGSTNGTPTSGCAANAERPADGHAPPGTEPTTTEPPRTSPAPTIRSCCETIDGQPLPVTTVERLCCEAIIHPILVDPDGRTVDQLGEPIRTANRQQRRALAALYSKCAHPHCNVPFDRCRIHHIIWYSRGGKTILINLAPVCDPHHHLVHEGGWNHTLDPTTRQLDWHRPNGTVAYTTHPDRLTNTTVSSPPAGTRSPATPAIAPPADTYQQPQLC